MIIYLLVPVLLLILLFLQLGTIESLILLSSILFSTFIFLGIVCLQQDNKCMINTNSGYQILLPLMAYTAPFENLKQNGIMQFIKNMFSLRTPYMYNLVGLIVGMVFVYAYKIGEEQEEESCRNQKRNIISKIKRAKEKDDEKQEKEDNIMEENMLQLKEREDILLQEVQENEEKKQAIRNEILKLVSLPEEQL